MIKTIKLFIVSSILLIMLIPTIALAIGMDDIVDDQRQAEIDRNNAKHLEGLAGMQVADAEFQAATLSNEIKDTKKIISDTEDDIDLKFDQGYEMLNIIQKNSYQNLILDFVFAGESNTDLMRRMKSGAKLMNATTKQLEELIELQIELDKSLIELEIDETNLAATVAYLQVELTKAHQHAFTKEEELNASREIAEYYASLGCKGDDRIGIDCAEGVIPPSGAMWRPMEQGYVTGHWGSYGGHQGTDIGNATNRRNTNIKATAPGSVTRVRGGCSPWVSQPKCNGGWGNYVVVDHMVNGEYVSTLYAHLSSINVSNGQQVTYSTTLGKMGNSGYSFGEHLHLEVWRGGMSGRRVDSRGYISYPPLWTTWYNRY